MLPEIVTLAEAKEQLRVTDAAEDALIELMIDAATEAVLDVASDWDRDSEEEPPSRLKLAVLTRVAIMYDNRESVEPCSGELPMLTPLRRLEI